MQAPPALKDAALRYADNGWKVFPLHGIVEGVCTCGTNCGKNAGKHPRIGDWDENASDDPAVIDRWWGLWPDANIGLKTGSVSGVWILDLDNKRSIELPNGVLLSEGDHSLRELENEHGKVPATLVCETGSGGKHLYFEWADDCPIRNRASVLPSVDVRGEGGYVVAPPSVHLSGSQYRWADEGDPIARPPSWLVGIVTKERERLDVTDSTVVGEGGRNDFLFRVAARLRGVHRLDLEDLFGALLVRNQRHCSPPLDREEVWLIAQSASQYPLPEFGSLSDGEDPDERGDGVPEIPEGSDLAIQIGELADRVYPPIRQIVEGMIDAESRTIIAGMGNLGKSWLVYDLCLAVASGTPYLGRDVSQGTVLLIDEESQERWVRERMLMLAEGREIGSLHEVPLYVAVERGLKIDTAVGNAQIRRLMERYRPTLVVFDSLIRMHTTDENNNREMARFFELVSKLVQVYECGVMFTHHVRKPSLADSSLGQSMRGAGDIFNVCETVLIATGTDNKNELDLHFAKQRNMFKQDPIRITLDVRKDDFIARVLEGDGSSATGPLTRIQQELAKIDGPTTADQLALRLGVTEATVKRHLESLSGAGAVERFEERIPGRKGSKVYYTGVPHE